MENRTKTLINMARGTDSEVLRQYMKQNRVCIDVRAVNGVEQTFCISNKQGDLRGDLNEQARLKRFAKNNAPTKPVEEPVTKETLTLKKLPLAGATLAQPTPIEFYKLCEWIKKEDLEKHADIKALAQVAGVEVAPSVGEVHTVSEAIQATGLAGPEHWLPPVDPIRALTRELSLFMEALGNKPSPTFTRLLKFLELA